MDSNAKAYISTATTTQIFNGPGTLEKIIITEAAAGTITVYDEATGGSTDIIAVFKASTVEATYEFNVACGKGLQIVPAAASKLTVVYNRG